METEVSGVETKYIGKTIRKEQFPGRKSGLNGKLPSALIRYNILKRSLFSNYFE